MKKKQITLFPETLPDFELLARYKGLDLTSYIRLVLHKELRANRDLLNEIKANGKEKQQ